MANHVVSLPATNVYEMGYTAHGKAYDDTRFGTPWFDFSATFLNLPDGSGPEPNADHAGANWDDPVESNPRAFSLETSGELISYPIYYRAWVQYSGGGEGT